MCGLEVQEVMFGHPFTYNYTLKKSNRGGIHPSMHFPSNLSMFLLQRDKTVDNHYKRLIEIYVCV
ncbi:hypothetical protein D2A77_13835 [Enterococcus faecalis]|nr:hypothetical protein [Enterococcus faecalis]EGO8793984.1 hypothetical protein [Enterococcus faecalis]EGO8997098.1 hypothetical protein [Enterococcus faecalis]PQB35000.1 hypothetical protein CUN31_00800 [Enterococcus faecalis]PQB43406.1 hypothetical protein CUM81_13155 [Enterococcus faecalis]